MIRFYVNTSNVINKLEDSVNGTRNRVIRSSAAQDLATAEPRGRGLTFLLISTLTSIPSERAAMGPVLTVILVFSGVLFRSFGKEKDRYKSY